MRDMPDGQFIALKGFYVLIIIIIKISEE